jgi:biopolymer transport protein ExbD
MRRFSSRNQLVTLNEINITPLLDLAFVLLIIFIITTPLLDQRIELKLPNGGEAKQTAKPGDVVTVEGGLRGEFSFKGYKVEGGERELEKKLVAAYAANRNLVVRIRVDRNGPAQTLVTILDICRRNGITRFDLATEAAGRR